MERTANLNDLALKNFSGPVAQLGWSVRLINLFRHRKVVSSNLTRAHSICKFKTIITRFFVNYKICIETYFPRASSKFSVIKSAFAVDILVICTYIRQLCEIFARFDSTLTRQIYCLWNQDHS